VVRDEARPGGAAHFGLVLAHEVFRDKAGVFAVDILALERLVAVVLEVLVDDIPSPFSTLDERAAGRARTDVPPRRAGLLLDQRGNDALGIRR